MCEKERVRGRETEAPERGPEEAGSKADGGGSGGGGGGGR